jgi:hypothetical protein
LQFLIGKIRAEREALKKAGPPVEPTPAAPYQAANSAFTEPNGSNSSEVNWTIVNRETGEHIGEPFLAPRGSVMAGALDRGVALADRMGIPPEQRRHLIIQPAD